MQTYKSRPFTLKKDLKSVYDLFMDPRSASSYLEKVEGPLQIKDVQYTDTGLTLDAPVVGRVKVERIESVEPSLIRYQGQGLPVPLTISIALRGGNTSSETIVELSVDAEVPAFLSGMIGSKVKPALSKVADALEGLDLDQLLGK